MSEDNVVDFPGITKLDLDPDRVLNAALGKTTECVIVGFDKEGELYFASSKADGGHVLWLFELAKKELLNVEI